MNRYRFYIAWKNGSEEAGFTNTLVRKPDDLIPEYHKGNIHIDIWEFECENQRMAYLLGYEKAFFEDYTDTNSFSIVEQIS